MDGRDLVRSVKSVGSMQGLRTVRSAWLRVRADARALPARGPERARVPGNLVGAEPGPGGGVVRFARSELRVRVGAGGAVFLGWDGAEPSPSYALPEDAPDADPRAVLEPDKDGGWQVVSERLTVVVSRLGAVELRTPGGVVLRRQLPPRWWEPVAGGPGRWVQRSEVPADARFFGPGGRAAGPRLGNGVYALWNSGPGGRPGPGDDGRYLTMPVQMVVSDAGTHLMFHDNSWAGRVELREGTEGAGSGHDRPGSSELRVEGGPLRCWVVVGTPARVLQGWSALTGAPAVPPSWALGPQHARRGPGSEREAWQVAAGDRDRGLPLSAPEGFGGDQREADDVGGLATARAGYDELLRLRPGERPFLVSRSGWAGTQRYGGIGSGDVAAGWPGLRASLALVLGLGLCGVPYAGPDVGGSDGSPSPELYLRWFQLGAYLPLFRTGAAIAAGRREPWEFGAQVLDGAREVLVERERLRPYWVTLAHLARLSGAPYVRPLWWSAPGDRALRECEDAFLLGDALLVAPVLEPGVGERPVRLPPGRWYDTVSGAVYEGPGQVVVEAPLSRVPVLARAGSVIPVRGADGGLELEVWAPVEGTGGGGSVVRDGGDGWAPTVVERYTTRLVGGRVVVERDGGEGLVDCPVRVRGI
ncbi:glycoside hydrolase family 31 protein [Streptomyces sp. NPDC096323]|uniref:glycoside hydrolase family 31 protein n=1 Tax=Streptomyces sp. NPDC096323 TaxID=3155822 RepID=UPI003329B325